MKKIYFTILAIFIVSQSWAQFNFGLKGGLNMNSFNTSKAGFIADASSYSPVGGLFFKFKAGHFTIEPELLFSQKGSSFDYSIDTVSATFSASYFDVPLMFGYQFWLFNFHTGPVFGFKTSEAISVSQGLNTHKTRLNQSAISGFNLGWQVGASIEVKKLVLGFRYETGISSPIGEFIVPNTNLTVYPEGRSSLFQLTLGIKFLSVLD